MLILRGMGAEDPDAPMVPSWAVDAPPAVTIKTDAGGKKTYVFEEPIEIEGKLPGKAKSGFPWFPVLGVAAALGAVWAWNKYGKRGRRPKARLAYA